MLLSLAWRNVWRNARRSLITMSALGVGVAGIVSIFSFREVANEAIVSDVTAGLVGHLQVHALGYQEAPSVGLTVQHPLQVEATLERVLPGAKAERRVIGAGLAGAGDRSAPVMVLGLEPGASALYTVKDGAGLGAGKDVLVGKDLATDLGVAVGGELVLVSQAADGSVANDRYTVAGTFESSSAELDGNAIAMSLSEAQSFFALGDGVHQLVVRLPTQREDVQPEAQALRAALDLKTLEAVSWSEMLPQMKASMEQKRKNQGFVDFIIFLIVGLGVFNAMTMAVFERTRELGVLAALGTRPRRILAMVMLEALWQGAMAFVVGVALAAAILYALGTSDLSKMLGGDVMGVRMPTHLELKLLPASLKGAAITAFLTALLGALLPALRAMRLQPVEALRQS
ncbi:MAG: ABC transporter permease [Archangiaceae bacterium]|nr:ABC transporter permease [Archangiaceae bacterium]